LHGLVVAEQVHSGAVGHPTRLHACRLPATPPQDSGSSGSGGDSEGSGSDGDGEEPQGRRAPAAAPALPSALHAEQYAPAAFDAVARAGGAAAAPSGTAGLDKLRPGQLPAALIGGTDGWPLAARLRALQQGLVSGEALALVDAAAHCELVAAWVAEDRQGAAAHARRAWRHLTEEQVRMAGAAGENRHSTGDEPCDGVRAGSRWAPGCGLLSLICTPRPRTHCGARQMQAVRGAFPEPLGADPALDRPFMAELLTKRLALAEAAGARGAGAAPWGVDRAARAADAEAALLEAATAVCDELGPPADWIRVAAAHAALGLRLRTAGTVDAQVLATFLRLLGRCRWEASATPALGPPGGGGAPPQPRPRPRPGVAAAMTATATGAAGGGGSGGSGGGSSGPGGAIFLYPDDPPLPHPLPLRIPDEARLREAAGSMVQRLAWLDAAGAFQPGQPDAFGLADAAGLPPAVLGARVAEGKLLSGRGDAAAWGRELQRHRGDAKALQELQDLVVLVGAGRGGLGWRRGRQHQHVRGWWCHRAGLKGGPALQPKLTHACSRAPATLPRQDFEPANAEAYSVADEVVLRIAAKNPGPQVRRAAANVMRQPKPLASCLIQP
jgi:hypothetical protein